MANALRQKSVLYFKDPIAKEDHLDRSPVIGKKRFIYIGVLGVGARHFT